MRMIKTVKLALMATLAFSMVGAFSAVSASALLFLTTSGKELLFTIKGLGRLVFEEVNGRQVLCNSALGDGSIVNKSGIARKTLLTFHECESGGSPCNSPGELSGLIAMLEMDALLVTPLTPLDKYALKLLAESGNLTEFSCGALSAQVRGAVVGEFAETLAESETIFKKEVRLVFEKGSRSGEPFITDYWTLNGLNIAKLELSNGIAFVEMNLRLSLDIIPDGGVKFCHK